MLPAILGLIAALAAGAAGGLGAFPRGRGQLARYLAN
jgi:putative ABC transport system permease protein